MQRTQHPGYTIIDLTEEEGRALHYFNIFLDKGYNVRQATEATLEQYPGLDPSFYTWIAE